MRTSRRAITVTVAPPEWRARCLKDAVRSIPSHARHADRSWWREYVSLIEEGYIDCPGSWSERHAARHMRCKCGEDMDLRAVEKIGPEGELIAYRTYAVCSMCKWWVEF
ncbi:MAG: hypothetical protein M3290_09635 [Actinomycetota bacterium]|nr:hypothetical protein [Actinomycetota bacterium]